MKALLLAMQFLTCFPVHLRAAPQPRTGAARRGLSSGRPLHRLLLAGLQHLLGHADPLLQAALLAAVWALVTGGLHLDGLADSADAWVGGHGDRERTLTIMKIRAAARRPCQRWCLRCWLKFTTLAVLAKTGAWQALLLAPLLGRSALVALLLTAPYVRPGGMGAAISAHLPRAVAVLVLLLVVTGGLLAGRPAHWRWRRRLPRG